MPRTDLAGLQSLAQTGGGRYAQLAPDESDLDRLLPQQLLPAGVNEGDEEDDYSADVWRDDGVWFAIALLPFLALGFRRGWLCALAICVLAPQPSVAFEWANLWQRPDQRGVDALEAGEPERAAELFEDLQWRGAAQYRASDYQGSAATLGAVDELASVYNRGNALARSGQLEAAIAAYEDVLDVEPEHEDAIYNKALVEELLSQQQQQQQQQQDQQSGQDQQSSDSSGENESEDGQQDSEQAAQAGESDQNSDPSDSENEQQRSEQTADNEQDSDSEPEESESQQQETEQLSAAAPEDIEEWASEQAADQWLRRVPQDPGGLLRRKFYYQYQRLGLDQDGRYVWPGDESEPW